MRDILLAVAAAVPSRAAAVPSRSFALPPVAAVAAESAESAARVLTVIPDTAQPSHTGPIRAATAPMRVPTWLLGDDITVATRNRVAAIQACGKLKAL
jgi:hypothetical protein